MRPYRNELLLRLHKYAGELAVIRAQYPSTPPRWTDKPCIIHWEEANQLLSECDLLDAEGDPIGPPGLDDLNTAQERALGELVADKYGTGRCLGCYRALLALTELCSSKRLRT